MQHTKLLSSGTFFFFFFLSFFGCAQSGLQHAKPSVFNVACRILSCCVRTPRCDAWDLVPQSEVRSNAGLLHREHGVLAAGPAGTSLQGDFLLSLCSHLLFFLFLKMIILFTCLFLTVLGLCCCPGFSLSLQQVEATSSSCSVQASRCCGFSCCETQAPGALASIVAARGVSSWAHRL